MNTNCCLSGLPIHQGDQIMTGLVGKTTTGFRDIGHYPCSLWSFFTPAVNAIYNSSIDNLKSDDATVLKLFLDLLRPKLEAKGGSKLSKENKYKLSHQQIWENLTKNNLYYVDSLFIFNTPLLQWSCHKWAWEHLNKMGGPADLQEEVKVGLTPYKDFRADNADLDQDSLAKKHNRLFSLSYYKNVFGAKGAFDVLIRNNISDLNGDLHAEYLKNYELIERYVLNMCSTVYNMRSIRKSVAPINNCGLYNQYEELKTWHKLVEEKSQELGVEKPQEVKKEVIKQVDLLTIIKNEYWWLLESPPDHFIYLAFNKLPYKKFVSFQFSFYKWYAGNQDIKLDFNLDDEEDFAKKYQLVIDNYLEWKEH